MQSMRQKHSLASSYPMRWPISVPEPPFLSISAARKRKMGDTTCHGNEHPSLLFHISWVRSFQDSRPRQAAASIAAATRLSSADGYLQRHVATQKSGKPRMQCVQQCRCRQGYLCRGLQGGPCSIARKSSTSAHGHFSAQGLVRS